jgi:hypothetical protein
MSVLDINEFDFEFNPNPVKNVLNIESKEKISSIDVITSTRQKVMSNVNVQNIQIHLDALAPNTYLLIVNFEGGKIAIRKFIKK